MQTLFLVLQLVQLSDELQRKDERIAELEIQLRSLVDVSPKHHDDRVKDTVATATTPQWVRPQCLRGQSSSSEGVVLSSPVATTRRVSSSDRLAMVPNLSPIEERRHSSSVFSQCSCDDDNSSTVAGGNGGGEGGSEGKSGNHSNKSTPRRRKISMLDREQQEVRICTKETTISWREMLPCRVYET